MTEETADKPTSLITALAAARRDMPRLPRSETGYVKTAGEKEEREFRYPSLEDLRAAVDLVFEKHELEEVLREMVVNGSTIALTWTLHHIPSGQTLPLAVTWPLFEINGPDGGRLYIGRAHASGATVTHAWRHLMMQLLKVKTQDGPAPEVTPPTPGGYPTPAELDHSVGREPAWSKTRPSPPVGPDAQWAAVDAVIEPDPAYDAESNYDLWAKVCAAGVKPAKNVLEAWHTFSGRPHDVLVPEDPAFKRHLRGLLPEVRS